MLCLEMFLYYITISMCVLWYLTSLWRIRNITTASKQFKSSFFCVPLMGHAYLFLGTNEDRMTTIKNLALKAIENGSNFTHFWLGLHLFILTVDADSVHILAKECLAKPHITTQFAKHLIGDGSLFATVPIWRPRRKVVARAFSNNILKGFLKVFYKNSLVTANKMGYLCNGNDYSVNPLFTSYSMNGICENILGIDSAENKPIIELFATVFGEYNHIMSKRVFKPWLFPDCIYKLTSDFAKLEELKKIILSTINRALDSKSRELSKGNLDLLNSTDKRNVSILEYLQMHQGLSKKEMLEEILVLAMAGIDTTAKTASFAMLLLSTHPDIQERLYKEIKDVVKDLNTPIEYDMLEKLKYLEAVLLETMRLYPPAPVIARYIHKDVILPSGLHFVKGSNIMINIWGIHRNPKYWGENPDAFNPSRFLDKSKLYPNAFIPFSIGPRNCIGYRYALLSLKTLLACLILQFKIEPASHQTGNSLRLELNITLRHKDNYQVKLKRR